MHKTNKILRFILPSLFAVSITFAGDINLARNKATSAETLTSLSKDHDEKIRMAVAANPSTPINVLLELAKDKEEAVVVKAIGNKSISLDAFASLIATKNKGIRSDVAKKHKSSKSKT